MADSTSSATAIAKVADADAAPSRSEANPEYAVLRKKRDRAQGAIFIGSVAANAAIIGFLCNYLGWVWPPALDAFLLMSGGVALWVTCGAVARHLIRPKPGIVHVPSMWQTLPNEPVVEFAGACLGIINGSKANGAVRSGATDIYNALPEMLDEWRAWKVRLEKIGRQIEAYAANKAPEALAEENRQAASEKDTLEKRVTMVLHFFDIGVAKSIRKEAKDLPDLEEQTKKVLEEIGKRGE